MRFVALTSIVLAAGAGAASATTLSEVTGRAFVSKGGGFVSASRGAVLAPGDRVVVEGQGTGTLLFSDGCTHPLTGGTVFTVTKTSPCASPLTNADRFQGRMGQSTTPAPLINPSALIVGGVVVGGGALAVITSQATSNPSSPSMTFSSTVPPQRAQRPASP